MGFPLDSIGFPGKDQRLPEAAVAEPGAAPGTRPEAPGGRAWPPAIRVQRSPVQPGFDVHGSQDKTDLQGPGLQEDPPFRGVYHRLKLYVEHQYSRGEEPRPTQLRLRCELELATEIGTQRALQKHRPALFQDYVLAAANHRLQWLQTHRAGKACRDWLNQTLLPRIGGRRRYGQKFNQEKNPPSELKCQLQWQTMDRMIHVVANGTVEDLKPLVQDPDLFIQHREKTAWIQTDATGVWV